MLRVGLTGGLGSGKSSVARVWAEENVPVLESDAIGRALMEPGEPVYARIVAMFGRAVVRADGQLNRGALAREVFNGGRLAELNAIVHPAVLAEQDRRMAELATQGCPLAVVESALIFEVAQEGKPWRERFDKLVLVTAPEPLRVERYLTRVLGASATEGERMEARTDAVRRMAAQIPEETKRRECDFVIGNDRTLVLLRREALWVLRALRKTSSHSFRT